MMITELIDISILKLYEHIEIKHLDDFEKYFCVNNVIDFSQISHQLLRKFYKDLTICEYEDFLSCYHILLPVLSHSLEVANRVNVKCLYLQWLGHNSEHLAASLHNDISTETGNIEQILLMTAILENALANVYYTATEGRPAPHLLRDLLTTNELKEVFGADAIIFLQILLGTPKSINLRNIVWHGFPKPSDIPKYYVSTLLLTIHTLGWILHKRNYKIQQRQQVREFTRHLSKFESQYKLFEMPHVEVQEEVMKTCHWLHEDYKIYWKQLFFYYKHEHYVKFVILVLPQIELLLRLCYGHVNEYDVSAKLDEYYITMDTIFENNVPTNGTTEMPIKKNRLFLFEGNSCITEGALKYMYDLFIAPNGPRLRDKISHGEVAINAINNKELCSILLYLSFNIMTGNVIKYSLDNYESKFHTNCLAYVAMNKSKIQLQQFHNAHLKTNVHFTHEISSHLSNGDIRIFQRPKKEFELMNLILKITQLLTQICQNYDHSINVRMMLLKTRELHSKRRRTLENLLAALPNICDSLQNIVNCMGLTFLRLQLHESDKLFLEIPKFEKILKFLKNTLKICENLIKYSDIDSNEWIKALEMCKRFTEIHEKLFVWK